ncbi:hypothetical protein B9Z19DRAFT_1069225 [Tuber borchii]|uniref:Uncharacterized protein n=1 Tax=Tuber borchii TaxID=42251 RepID=A0A2T6ZCC2_TUBBO|nr:hypothetical protein B9Z19DRAFT_1069225 [Tuber borchii]
MATVRTTKLPKHIAEIGMTAEQYFELKVHIKSIILPGTPAFESKRIDSKDPVYRQWLINALREIGPRFFSRGGNGLVWPEERAGISRAVHQVIRALGAKIKLNYKLELGVAGNGTGDGVEMARDNEHYEGGDADDTDPEEDIVMADEKVLPEDQENGVMIMIDQNDQAEKRMEEEMEAAAIELEDLLALMQPEAFAQFPDFDDDYFDWDELMDSNTSDGVRHLANLDQ